MIKQIFVIFGLCLASHVFASESEIRHYCKAMGSYADDIAVAVSGDYTGFGKMRKDEAMEIFTRQQDEKSVKKEIGIMVEEIYKSKPKREVAEKMYYSKCLIKKGLK